ncbi:hypothetical protein IFM89_021103 [Coptis chinensis]|uniref:Ubiquitin-like protease family profile domain-containing protein n=1 Tax=Coptis chinensis TaxID=261450 RepID=A0A835HNN1_9MAGN|nr:hypothetical protein IFM89_021103 [Coptis chinensis]
MPHGCLHAHWFLPLYHKLSGVGGFEIESGCYINPVFPGDAAMELKGNICVFCRVRPMLPDDGASLRTEQQVHGILNLIDLANSERLSKSGSTGDRLKETQKYMIVIDVVSRKHFLGLCCKGKASHLVVFLLLFQKTGAGCSSTGVAISLPAALPWTSLVLAVDRCSLLCHWCSSSSLVSSFWCHGPGVLCGMKEALEATKVLVEDCRLRGTTFHLGAVLRELLVKFLPDDVLTRSNGRVREKNVIVETSTLNVDAPFNEFIAARGLFPMFFSLDQRFPFYDNVFDLVHAVNSLGKGGHQEKMEFFMFDIDRVLRVGSLFWLDNFHCVDEEKKMTLTREWSTDPLKIVAATKAIKLDSDIRQYRRWYIPILKDHHWWLYAIDPKDRTIVVMDSLSTSASNISGGLPFTTKLVSYMHTLLRAHGDAHATYSLVTDWIITQWEAPRQANGYDCGVFTCKFMEFWNGQQLNYNFTQLDIPYFRHQMAVSMVMFEYNEAKPDLNEICQNIFWEFET